MSAQAEASLARLIADSSGFWESLEDPRGKLVWVSPACEAVTGHRPEEFLRDPGLLPAIMLPEDRALFASHESSSRGSERSGSTYFRILRDDGDVRWISHSCKPVFFPGETTPGRRASNQDVTDLESSEERFRSLFDTMLNGLAHCEMLFEDGRPADFVYLEVNRAFEELTGLREVVGKRVTEVIPGVREANPELFEIYGRVATTGVPERFETFVPALGIWFSVSAYSPLTGHFVAVFDNVTARKRAEEALRNSEEQYRTLFESMKEAFVSGELICDDEGRPTDFRHLNVNPAFTDLTGLPADQVVGRTVREVIPDFETFWIEAFSRVVRSGLAERVEGSVSRLGRRYEAFVWRSGPGRFGTVFNDVTERRKAEEQLEELASFPRLNPMPVVEADLDGRVHFVNPSAKRLFPDVERLGTAHPWLADWTSATRAFREGGPESLPREVTVGGRTFHQTLHFVRKTERVRIYGAEITARKEAEVRLRELNETLEQRVRERTAEAEERAAQLSGLAYKLTRAELKERQRLAGALHDHLQQILAAAKFHLDTLTDRVSSDELRDLSLKVGELLDDSIAECRTLTVGLSPPLLKESGFATALGWLARRMEEQHRLSVTLAVADGGAEPTDDDVKAFLFDAVRELLFNVAKHSGALTARVTLDRADGQLELTVEDSGRGFDPELLRGRRGEAGGFGLFSIQQRLELFGGSLVVSSGPGRGTRVTLSAPTKAVREEPKASLEFLAGSASVEESGSHRIPTRAERIRVLIADDHRILRQGLIALLKADPAIEVVGEAADGVEAVELARSLKPHVIVMDVSMPRMNGIEATRLIVAELPRVRVVGLSMHEDETIAGSMREAGAVDFVTKGGRSDGLISAIRAAFGAGPAPRSG